jgi:hypothetical protein
VPQRLCSIDVTESSDQALIEQCGFDRTASRRQCAVQRLRRERRICRLRSKTKLERRTGRVKIDRAESTWIVEHDACSIGEAQDGARKSRQLVVDSIDVPIARHAKMRV